MAVTKAHIKATTKYESKAYDKILVRVKKGTREQLKAILGEQSINGFLVECIEDKIKEQG